METLDARYIGCWVFKQRHFVVRPGFVRCAGTDPVSVGGPAVTALDGSIVVSASEADDIIEA